MTLCNCNQGRLPCECGKEPNWSSSSGLIELYIAWNDAASVTHPGPCDADVAELCTRPYMAEQLGKIDPVQLAVELGEYGAWDEHERSDHAQNLQRLVWIAAGDIAEGRA